MNDQPAATAGDRQPRFTHELLAAHFRDPPPEQISTSRQLFLARMRPGRIDQAIEFPLPDDEGRDKLVRLYTGKLVLSDALRAALVTRTAGVSAAFIKELMRRLAQASLAAEPPAVLASAHVDAALGEMLFAGGVLNARLLGGAGNSGMPA